MQPLKRTYTLTKERFDNVDLQGPLRRTYTLTKERFDNVDLSSSSDYFSGLYRRASRSTGAAAAAARANVASAYTAASPTIGSARDNMVATTSGLWSRSMSLAAGWYGGTASGGALQGADVKATLTRLAGGAPFPRAGHSLAVVKGRAYIFGGESSPGQLAGNEMNIVFLPAYEGQEVDYTSRPARPREKGGPVPAPRKGHVAVVIGDAVCIFGGEVAASSNGGEGGTAAPAEEETPGRVWVFDTATNTWDYLDPIPESPYPAPRHGHAAASSELPEPVNTQIKPDRDILPQQPPEAGEFLPEPPAVASWGTLFVYGGTAVSKSGSGDEGAGEGQGELLNDAWAFDLCSRAWYALPPPPGPARTGANLLCSRSELWRLGGFDGQGYVGDKADRLDISGLWSFGAQGSALGELTRASGLDEWVTLSFDAPGGAGAPIARANAGAIEVGIGARGFVALVGGQGSAHKGKGKDAADGSAETVSEDDATRVLDDIWTFQIPTGKTPMADMSDGVDERFAARSARLVWEEVEYSHVDPEGDVKLDSESVEATNQFRMLRRRAGFAVAKGSEVEGSAFVVWGGVDGRGGMRSDGYMVSMETGR